jgi:hypothetical protein
MPRIKFTGYIDIIDLEQDQLDLSDPTGLSAKGQEDLTSDSGRFPAPRISELEDLETEVEA